MSMATSTRKRVRYMLDVTFSTVEEKDAFTQRLNNIRKRLTPGGSSSLDNCSLMLAMFDAVEREATQSQELPSFEMEPMDEQEANTTYTPLIKSFQRNSGMFRTIVCYNMYKHYQYSCIIIAHM